MLEGLRKTVSRLAATAALVLGLAVPAWAQLGEALPTGQRLTPTAASDARFEALDPGLPDFPDYRAGQAVALALSPDGATLLVQTSGYNRLADRAGRRAAGASSDYVFVYDVAAGAPRQRQVIKLANSFQGIAWYPDGSGFAVSGGVDDTVHGFSRTAEGFAGRMVANAFEEFWPDLKKRVFH